MLIIINRKLLWQLKKLITDISQMLWSLLIFFYVFGYFANNIYYAHWPEYFGSLFGSFFTMFQVFKKKIDFILII